MCIDAKTSAAAFIIGTIFNVIGVFYYRTSVYFEKYLAIALVWQHVLLMQVADFLGWMFPTCGTTENKMATSLAYAANVTQPLVIYLCLMQVTEADVTTRVAASTLLLIYMAHMLVNAMTTFKKHDLCLRPTSDCKHLDYYWWKDNNGGLTYHVSVIGLILLLFRPLSFAVAESAYILLAFVLSGAIYRCGVPSVWCLFASMAPVFNLFIFKYLVG